MKNNIKTYILILIAILSISSCAPQKKVTYLQNTKDGYAQEGYDSYEIRIRPDDLISIVVSSKDPELAQMLNLSMISSISNASLSGQRMLGYLVDKNGEIDFPQLGKIKIGGMTRDEVMTYVKDQLISKGLVNDPVITIEFLNFKVSVMGEVARPSTVQVASDRITIFDALSAAGDLTVYGRRDNVKIIREIGGKKTVNVVDLRSADILDSPFYYLQQNDVIYVEPNRAKAGQSEINTNRSIGTYATIVSVLLSATSLILSIMSNSNSGN